jgi:hypothetical protein
MNSSSSSCFSYAAIGKPQAVISEETLAEMQEEEEAISDMLLNTKTGRTSRHMPRSLSLSNESNECKQLLTDSEVIQQLYMLIYLLGPFSTDDIQFYRSTGSRGHYSNYSMGAIDVIQAKHGMSLSFQPFSMSFEDVGYSVDMPVVSFCISHFTHSCSYIHSYKVLQGSHPLCI